MQTIHIHVLHIYAYYIRIYKEIHVYMCILHTCSSDISLDQCTFLKVVALGQ